MNRRNLLTAAAASVMLPGAVKAGTVANPDADLLAICAEFDVCERQTSIIHGTGPDCVVDDDEADVASAPFFARMYALLDRMKELRATTPAGIQARAHSLAQHAGHGEYSFDYGETIPGRLLIYLMRDSAALGGLVTVTPVPPHPDADLIRICAEHVVTMNTFNASVSDAHADLLLTDYERTRNAITETKPRTLAGMQAKARAAKAEALPSRADGNECPEGTPAETWAWQLVNDLLAGRAEA